MRTTLTIDDAVLEAAQALAKTTGKGLGEVLSDLARRSFDDAVLKDAQTLAKTTGKGLGEVLPDLARRSLPKKVTRLKRKNKLPLFRVSHDAEVIPGNRAAEMLAEELL